MSRLIWYFDFVSPYTYLQFAAYPGVFRRPGVELKPLLFAALLNHWGHKGPAEIPAKRLHTFRQVLWQAKQLGVDMKCPPAHPFNPLPALRLAIALGSQVDAVQTIFEFIWKEGRSLGGATGDSGASDWAALCARLGVGPQDARLNSMEVKEALRANGEAALAAGVFGVPTFVIDGVLFWGADATAMLLDYLEDPRLFESAEMRAIDSMPVAASRRQR